MKKIAALLFFAFCMVSIAFAVKTIIVHDTVKPNIEATFNESVIIDKFNFTSSATGKNIDMSYISTDKTNKTFIFTPMQSLPNGYYFFIVFGQDKIGNTKNYTRNIIISVNQTDIYYISPLLGISSNQKYDLDIGTSRDARCRWSGTDKPYSQMAGVFFTTGSTVHVIKDFVAKNIDTNESETKLPKIYIGCNDTFGFIVKKALPTGWDPTAPTISTTVDGLVNGKIIKHPPQAIIKVTSDDRVVCFAKDTKTSLVTPFDGQNRFTRTTYDYYPQLTLNYPDVLTSNGDYNYQITCENLATTPLASPPSVKITVALQNGLGIVVNKPGDYISNELVYDIETTERANCTATLDGNSNTEANLDNDITGTKHTLLYNGQVSEGPHIATIYCIDSESKQVQKQFTVDLSPPINLSVNASACKEKELSLAFSAKDPQSGVNGYYYSVSGPGVNLDWKFTSANKVTETSFKLNLSQTYSVQVKAINNAKLNSTDVATSTFTFNPNITIACQEKNPPIIKLNITDTTYGKKVGIICQDDSGCDQSSIQYGLSDNSTCSVSSYGTEVLLQKAQYVCWQAADKWGNIAKGSQFVKYKVLNPSCTNGILDGIETDVDCGGDCLGCQVGLTCSVNKDCAENYCSQNKCAKPSCTDNLKNGFETDVDCGGDISCNSCATGKSCLQNSDCTTNYCKTSGNTTGGICAATLCTDGIKNGFETDVDCGGKECTACAEGKSCSIDTDCSGGSCQFGQCGAGKETFEQWAAKNNIDPTDKNGDADKDGLSNYDEYLHGTDPNKADSDGDGYTDGEEIAAGTNPLDNLDFPSSNLYRYLLIALGVIILLLGLVLLYYFKAEQQASLGIVIAGAGLLVFLIVDWLLFKLPKPVLYVLAVGSFGATGYLMYTQRTVVTQKFSGKPAPSIRPVQKTASQAETIVGKAPSLPPEESRVRREDLTATQQMVEMIRREKHERERKREQVFEKFGGTPKTTGTIEKLTIPKSQIIAKKTEKTTSVIPMKEKSVMERLGDVIQGRKESDIERLSKMTAKESTFDRTKRKEEAFEKLSSLSRSKTEDIFNKLPSSEKKIDELSDLEKKRKKKK